MYNPTKAHGKMMKLKENLTRNMLHVYNHHKYQSSHALFSRSVCLTKKKHTLLPAKHLEVRPSQTKALAMVNDSLDPQGL